MTSRWSVLDNHREDVSRAVTLSSSEEDTANEAALLWKCFSYFKSDTSVTYKDQRQQSRVIRRPCFNISGCVVIIKQPLVFTVHPHNPCATLVVFSAVSHNLILITEASACSKEHNTYWLLIKALAIVLLIILFIF